jgi:hypothetical protein
LRVGPSGRAAAALRTSRKVRRQVWSIAIVCSGFHGLAMRSSLALWTDFPQDRAVLNLAPRKLDATSRKASYVA